MNLGAGTPSINGALVAVIVRSRPRMSATDVGMATVGVTVTYPESSPHHPGRSGSIPGSWRPGEGGSLPRDIEGLDDPGSFRR